MAKSRIASRVKKTATESAVLNSAELLKKCGLELEAEMAGIGTDSKVATEKRITALTLPESVERVLVDLQNRLFEVYGILVCIHAQAEDKDCDSQVRWALEAALKLFEPIIDEVDDRAITKAAAELEVAP